MHIPDNQPYRYEQVAAIVGVSRASIEKAVRRGEFPRPDRRMGRIVMWSREIVDNWVSGRSTSNAVEAAL